MSKKWIWQQATWPQFHWQQQPIQTLLNQAYFKQGKLLGLASGETALLSLDTILQNILSSSAIEQEYLQADSVRSSLANKLAISEQMPFPVDKKSEGVASMML